MAEDKGFFTEQGCRLKLLMKNAKFHTQDVKKTCENKLQIEFRLGKEYNGWFLFNGRKAARITIPKGRKPIPPKTYKSMANQLRLTVQQFDQFLECPLVREHYVQILSDRLSNT